MRREGFLLLLAAGVACASPGRQPPTTTPTPAATRPAAQAGQDAGRRDCVVMQAVTEGAGLREERLWQEAHYPGSKKVAQALTAPDETGKIYDLIDIVTAAGDKQTLCFDITSFFGHL
jgi:hypothetical protein